MDVSLAELEVPAAAIAMIAHALVKTALPLILLSCWSGQARLILLVGKFSRMDVHTQYFLILSTDLFTELCSVNSCHDKVCNFLLCITLQRAQAAWA